METKKSKIEIEVELDGVTLSDDQKKALTPEIKESITKAIHDTITPTSTSEDGVGGGADISITIGVTIRF